MKCSLPLLGLALTLLAAAPASTEPIQIAWVDCAGAPDALDRMEFACDRNTGVVMPIVASFVAPAGLPDFVGTTTKLEIRVAGGTIPDWWHLEAGGCRAGALGPSQEAINDLSGLCANPYLPAPAGGLSHTAIGQDGVIRVTIDAISAGVGPALQTGRRYVSNVINLRALRTVSAAQPACGGCGADASIAVTEVLVASQRDQVILRPTGPAPAVVYVGADGPGSVPVARATWGGLKALYR